MNKLKLPERAPATGENIATAERDAVQGEGDYASAEKYNRATRKFVQNEDVQSAARDAAPATPAEAAELARAEDKGRARSRGEDDGTPRRRGRFLRRRR